MNGLDEIKFLVLGFMRLGQAGLAWGLDADENLVEIGIAQQAQQFLVSDHVNAGLRVKGQGPALPAIPPGKGLQKLPSVGAMAHEVVVGEKNNGNPGAAPGLDLAHHLVDRFEAHLAAKYDNDIAELAAERTAPGTLYNSMRVAPAHEFQAGR